MMQQPMPSYLHISASTRALLLHSLLIIHRSNKLDFVYGYEHSMTNQTLTLHRRWRERAGEMKLTRYVHVNISMLLLLVWCWCLCVVAVVGDDENED